MHNMDAKLVLAYFSRMNYNIAQSQLPLTMKTDMTQEREIPSATAGTLPHVDPTPSTPSTPESSSYPAYLDFEWWFKQAKENPENVNAWLAIYGLLDVIALSQSLLKLIFDMFYNMQNSEAAVKDMRAFLRSPEGIGVAVIFILPAAILSAIANSYYNSSVPSEKNFYRGYQKYRDPAKGGKNAVTGAKNLLKSLQSITSEVYITELMWLGLTFALLSMINRTWMRNMTSQRKKNMDAYKQLIKAIKHWGSFDSADIPLPEDGSEALKAHIHGFRLADGKLYYVTYNYQADRAESIPIPLTEKERKHLLEHIASLGPEASSRLDIHEWRHLLPKHAEALYTDFFNQVEAEISCIKETESSPYLRYASATYGGFIDGLYMLAGLSTIAPTPAIAGISLLYSVGYMAGRIHEEKDFQNKCIIEQQKTIVALHARKVEAELAKLNEISYALSQLNPKKQKHKPKIKKLDALQKTKNNEVNAAVEAFFAEYDALHDLHKKTTTDAVFLGIRHGLSMYNAILCTVSAISLISLMLFATPLPEIIAFATVAVGILLITGSILYHLWVAKQEAELYKEQEGDIKNKLNNFINYIKDQEDPTEAFTKNPNLTDEPSPGFQEFLHWSVSVALPVYYISYLADLLRSTFSGVMKGVKTAFFILGLTNSPDDDLDDIHHDLDPEQVQQKWLLLIPSFLLFTTIWAGRSIAKTCKDLKEYFTTKSTENQPKPAPPNTSEASEKNANTPTSSFSFFNKQPNSTNTSFDKAKAEYASAFNTI